MIRQVKMNKCIKIAGAIGVLMINILILGNTNKDLGFNALAHKNNVKEEKIQNMIDSEKDSVSSNSLKWQDEESFDNYQNNMENVEEKGLPIKNPYQYEQDETKTKEQLLEENKKLLEENKKKDEKYKELSKRNNMLIKHVIRSAEERRKINEKNVNRLANQYKRMYEKKCAEHAELTEQYEQLKTKYDVLLGKKMNDDLETQKRNHFEFTNIYEEKSENTNSLKFKFEKAIEEHRTIWKQLFDALQKYHTKRMNELEKQTTDSVSLTNEDDKKNNKQRTLLRQNKNNIEDMKNLIRNYNKKKNN